MTQYRALDSKAGQIVFADTNDVTNQLKFKNSIGNVGSTTVRILRNSVILTRDKMVLKPGCTEMCDAVKTTESVRIELSASLNDSQGISELLAEAIRVIEIAKTDGLLTGFLPSLSQTFASE